MISHIEAQALISARLDEPLDPLAERELQAHLATCPTCRAFANQTANMTHALRELPYLPASPAVSRTVMEHIQRPTPIWGAVQQWVSPNLGSAVSTIAAVLVVAVLSIFVLTRIVGQDGGDHEQQQVLNAPAQETQSAVAINDRTPTVAPTTAPTQAAPTAPPTTTGQGGSTGVPTTGAPSAQPTAPGQPAGGEAPPTQVTQAPEQPQATNTEAPEPTSPVTDAGEQAQIVVPTTVPSAVPTSGDTQVAEKATTATGPTQDQAFNLTGEGTPEATKTPAPAVEPTAVPTEVPSETPVPTEEPTVTEAPTAEPTETPVPTTEPTATAVPTQGPTEVPAPTEAPAPPEVPTETPAPTETPVPTEVPTETPLPTATSVPTAEPTETPSDESQVILPADGTYVATSEIGAEATTASTAAPTEPAIEPQTTTVNTPVAGNGNAGNNGQVIEPASSGEATPETAVPEPTSPVEEPGGEQRIEPSNSGDNQRRPTPQPTDGTGGPAGVIESGTATVASEAGDLSSAESLGSFGGGAGDRLVYENGGVGVSSAPGVANPASFFGATLAEQPGTSGQSVFVCLGGGECTDATSASAEGTHTDVAIGWIDSLMVYQRDLPDGTVEYRAAFIDPDTGEANDDRQLQSGGPELRRSGNVFAYGGGLLVESSGGWVMVWDDHARALAAAESSSPRSLVRIYENLGLVTYVTNGQLVLQGIDDGSVTTLPFSGVDYDLSPGGDQVVVSTGSGIELLDRGGNVTGTFANAQGIATGSVLWMPDGTIDFVDQSSGQIRSIPVDDATS
ncbi:MAG: zf-HC2 domain-containing protein [Thermomicrobiales bacterium]